jgi:hypothetical protein
LPEPRAPPHQGTPPPHGKATSLLRLSLRADARDLSCSSAEDADAIAAAHAAVLGEVRPVSTMVVVTGFLDPRWKVEIEAEATLDG